MKNNQGKSKAFIITFIAVLLLLVSGYFIFKNSPSIFGTKSALNTDKSFTPLLGTSAPKDLNTVDNNTNGSPTGSTTNSKPDTLQTGQITNGSISNQGTTNNGGANNGVSLGNGSGIKNGNGIVNPPFNPIPAPTGNGPVQTQTNPITNTGVNNTPTPTVSTPTINPNICPSDDPLIFTDEEKAELDSLLSQYYLMAPTLKTDDDLAMLESDITINQNLIDEANDLTTACMAQKSDPSYTGPQAIKDNPYYSGPVNSGATFYLPAFGILEQVFNIW